MTDRVGVSPSTNEPGDPSGDPPASAWSGGTGTEEIARARKSIGELQCLWDRTLARSLHLLPLAAHLGPCVCVSAGLGMNRATREELAMAKPKVYSVKNDHRSRAGRSRRRAARSSPRRTRRPRPSRAPRPRQQGQAFLGRDPQDGRQGPRGTHLPSRKRPAQVKGLRRYRPSS